MSKSQSKRIEIIGARLNEEESARWLEVVRRANARNRLVTVSNVLRDLLFGDLGIMTDADRAYLMGRDSEPGALLSGDDSTPRHLMSNGTGQPLTEKQAKMVKRDISKAGRVARGKERRKKRG